jgi:phage anti-repressor protein
MPDMNRTTDLSLVLDIHSRVIGGEWTQTVDARNLHAELGIATRFTAWITRRIEEYGFVEGVDYFFPNLGKKRGRPQDSYQLTFDMAKELCMVERSAIGRQVRQYFLACEKMMNTGAIAQRLESLEARLAAFEIPQPTAHRFTMPEGRPPRHMHVVNPPTIERYGLPGVKRTMPDVQIAKRVEVSWPMAQVWHFLRTNDYWFCNSELANYTGVKERTTRSYTYYFYGVGLLACQEIFPQHLYRMKNDVDTQFPEIVSHLDACYDILKKRAEF